MSRDVYASYSETLLQQGKYHEWFYEGFTEKHLAYLRQPAEQAVTFHCQVCGEYKVKHEFSKNTWFETSRCNSCVLKSKSNSGDPGRYENKVGNRWREQAACKEADPDVFFPEIAMEYTNPRAPWRQYCPQCPVREECLASAKQTGVPLFGIFGGLYFDSKGREHDASKPVSGKPRKVL